MASVTSIPAHLRGVAARIDEKLRNRLSQADLHARAEYAALLIEKSDGQQAEHFRYLQAEARKVLCSVPVLEFVQRNKELGELADKSPATIMADGMSIASLHRSGRAQLREANSYPPGLEAAVDGAILNRPVGDQCLAETAEAIIAAGIIKRP